MSELKFYRTAESVSPGHPDKLCDQISDAILDAYLEIDPDARVAVETCGGHDVIFIVGEVTSKAKTPDIRAIVERITKKPVDLCEVSPSDHKLGRTASRVSEGDTSKGRIRLFVQLVEQSSEIASGVDTGGAGDQGIMIGYATDETEELLPREVVLSRSLNQHIYEQFPYDGKTQVTIAPDGAIASIVASFQNASAAELEQLVQEFIKEHQLTGALELHLNPAGDWQQGGFDADTGLTGRKLIVDNYGPRIPIGGGCFSGKDPSKVDRSAAYMARRIAVDYLKKRQAHEVLVRLAYAIGYDQPLEQTVIIDGKPEAIEGYDLTPRGIIKFLDLKRPIYEETARYGHFGHAFTWDD